MERETGIEPATNSLEGCDSTIELLPPGRISRAAAREHNHSTELETTRSIFARISPRFRAGLPLAWMLLELLLLRRLIFEMLGTGDVVVLGALGYVRTAGLRIGKRRQQR